MTDEQVGAAAEHLAIVQLAQMGGPNAWRAIRESANRSRAFVAEQVGVTRQSPWDWEMGRRRPSASVAPTYLRVLLQMQAGGAS